MSTTDASVSKTVGRRYGGTGREERFWIAEKPGGGRHDDSAIDDYFRGTCDFVSATEEVDG